MKINTLSYTIFTGEETNTANTLLENGLLMRNFHFKTEDKEKSIFFESGVLLKR